MGWGLGDSCNQVMDKDALVTQYRDSLNKSKGRVEILEQEQLKLEQELSEAFRKIALQKAEINKLKKIIDDKVDSVRNLSNKQSLEYITKWLSQRSQAK